MASKLSLFGSLLDLEIRKIDLRARSDSVRRCLLEGPVESQSGNFKVRIVSLQRFLIQLLTALCYSLCVSQPVNGRSFSILEKQTFLCLFLDEFEMSSVALLPDRSGCGPMFNVSGEPWLLLAFRVEVVFRLVAWC